MPELYNSQNSTSSPRPPRNVKDYSEVMRRHHHTKNPLTSFMVRPPNVKVSIQHQDEKIFMVLRRHFITNVGWISVVILMALAPALTSYLPVTTFLPDRFNIAVTVLWYLLTFGIGMEGFLSWYYNVFIITDERIIDVDFTSVIYKNVSAAKINNIEDVTVQMGGALRSVLNFGTVFVQTAAEKTEFEFEDVPRPQEVSKFLNELILEEEREEIEGRVV